MTRRARAFVADSVVATAQELIVMAEGAENLSDWGQTRAMRAHRTEE